MGVISEDVDFLDVGELFEIYKNRPEILFNFLHVDLDEYQELMPEDIRHEYIEIKGYLSNHDSQPIKEESNPFKELIIKMVNDFKKYIEQKKVYKLLNSLEGNKKEKEVQIFYLICLHQLFLRIPI